MKKYPDCIVCGAPSTRLCDYRIGWKKKIYRHPLAPQFGERATLKYPDREVIDGVNCFTCDAPLCDKCRRESIPVFWSGEDLTPEEKVSSEDYCPVHAERGHPLRGDAELLDEEGAGNKRERIFAALRSVVNIKHPLPKRQLSLFCKSL